MAKRSVSVGMTRMEKILGGGLLAAYLVILPLAADPLFDGIEKLFGTPLSGGARDAAYYCILFALAVIALWGYWGRTARALFDHVGTVLASLGIGLVAFYGLNEIIWRVMNLFSIRQTNLNDQAILARLGSAPCSTILIVVFLAPFVEEAVFRGYIFGNLREFSRPAAYLVSCLVFALLHVWQFVAVNWDFSYLLLALQYFAPALVMAWTFERSGSLWGSILLHGIVNGLSVLSVI